jgi:hypothetical protein
VEFVFFVRHNTQLLPTKIDTRSKFEVLDDLRAKGIDAWPVTMPFEYIQDNVLPFSENHILPFGGISNKTVVFCNEGGQFIILENDEHGFNNPKGLYKKGDIKVALVGDSYVHGACVKPGEDIASQFRKMGISALNLGSMGNGPLIELALIKEYAEPIHPEIVLWVYYEGNDLSDLNKERKSSMLMRYLEDDYSQNLLERQDEIDTILINYVNNAMKIYKNKLQEERKYILRIMKLWNLRNSLGSLNKTSQTLKNELTPKSAALDPNLILFSKILYSANQRVTGWGGRFYFVYLSGLKRYMYNNNKDEDYYLLQYREDVLNIVHELGIPLIDFKEVLDIHPDRLSLSPFPDRSSHLPFIPQHYNAKGYKLITDCIASKLRKDGVIFEER